MNDMARRNATEITAGVKISPEEGSKGTIAICPVTVYFMI